MIPQKFPNNFLIPLNPLESNIYEDQKNKHNLNSEIHFEEYFIHDYNEPGVESFVIAFTETKSKGQ